MARHRDPAEGDRVRARLKAKGSAEVSEVGGAGETRAGTRISRCEQVLVLMHRPGRSIVRGWC